VLRDPVLAGQARIEDPVGYIAGHFLRSDQHAVDLGIVDGREVRPRARVDVEPGAGEQLDRRILQRPLGDSELEYLVHVCFCCVRLQADRICSAVASAFRRTCLVRLK
jgi:hypothetical protein